MDIEGLAALAVENLQKLPEFYANADSDIKRAIVGSIYPEKWFLTEKPIEPLNRMKLHFLSIKLTESYDTKKPDKNP